MAYDKPIAIITTICEASSATALERRAVLHTFFNRQTAGRYGHSIFAICLTHAQYSEWLEDKSDQNNLLRFGNLADNDPMIHEVEDYYDEIFSGETTDPTNGATHYHDLSVTPYWAKPPAVLTLATKKFRFYKAVP